MSLPRLAIPFLVLGLFGVARAEPTSPARGAVFDPPLFGVDVQAVLARAGCNLGVCHGNKNGKGGFRLSLRGEDPAHDLRALTREHRGRRVDRTAPERSLILLKATGQVSHEGGVRFGRRSAEYETLVRWIEEGASEDPPGRPRLVALEVASEEAVIAEPAREFQIRARARFSDGIERDVTSLAVYEASRPTVSIDPSGRVEREEFGEVTVLVRYLDRQVPVRLAFIPAREDFVWRGPEPANFIDEAIFAKLERLRLSPAPLVDDLGFLRRATLDVLGQLPSAAETRRFLDDPREDRRARLVDELLERPEFADHWALKWSDLLRNEEKALDRKGVQAFHGWIRETFARDRSLAEFAREILSATGSTYGVPATNFYRATREVNGRAETAAQVFLGVRLQCAKCHNHPFDRWTQDDYYGWSAVFSGVRYKVLQNLRRDRNDKHEFRGEQIVFQDRGRELKDPRDGEVVAPAFLGEAPLERSANRLRSVGEWVAAADNPFFSRVQANRLWAQILGRGLVDPVDDFRATNPASHPELLERLARLFREEGFRVRPVLRAILNSNTYRIGAGDREATESEAANHAAARPRRIAAEPLLDAFSHVLDAPLRFNGYPEGLRATQIPGVTAIRPRYRRPTPGDKFLKLFGKPERLLACECERSGETTLAQAFQLISGPALDELLRRPDNRLGQRLAAGAEPTEIIGELYREALGRGPGEEELALALELVGAATTAREGLEDVAWSILNAKEFLLRP